MMERSLYWNNHGFAVAIVAVEGGNRDWAAYIGATDGKDTSEEATVEAARRYGSKISQKMAEFLFPDFPEAGLRWRE